MISIKPGRASSFMSGIVGLLFAGFGIVWTVGATNIDGIGFLTFFGILFVIMGLCISIYGFISATRKNRFSEMDITTGNEEPDPLNQIFGGKPEAGGQAEATGREESYCPYCGAKIIDPQAKFCAKCGKELPKQE